MTAFALDWNQTVRIGDRCLERNPFLGKCPSRQSINLYFVSVMLGHTLVAAALPKPWRTFFQGYFIALEGTQAFTNGYRIQF
jgi:hypothetical protein